MTNIEEVHALIEKNFQVVSYLPYGIVRGERQHNGKPFAVTYIDLSDDIVEKSEDLKRFQEDLIGADYFSSENDLRWNSYLYFWAGPRSTASPGFSAAKSKIESDRHFARKLVLDETSLSIRLGEIVQDVTEEKSKEVNVAETWAEILRSNSLTILLTQEPRTVALEKIVTGEAFQLESAKPSAAPKARTDVLAYGKLRYLNIEKFRRIHTAKSYEFVDVNLIYGPNGTGKTSLLEAIEVLYCGRVRRDQNAQYSDVIGKFEDHSSKLTEVRATSLPAIIKDRNLAWYGRTDALASAITQGFTRFNFLDTDAAFRLASDQTNEQILNDFAKLVVGADVSKFWHYLSKLNDEVSIRLKSLVDQLQGIGTNVELLGQEVSRLKAYPSESKSLLESFRLQVAQLKPTWQLPNESEALAADEKIKISKALKLAQIIIASLNVTPVTKERVFEELARNQSIFESTKLIQNDFETTLQLSYKANSNLDSLQAQIKKIEGWKKYLDFGIPDLASRQSRISNEIRELQLVLRTQPTDENSISPEYVSVKIQDGISNARQIYEQAMQQEQSASTAHAQAKHLGATLFSLKQEIFHATTKYIEQSGERDRCPVCKTSHVDSELQLKLQELIVNGAIGITDGLRFGLQVAKDNVEKSRRDLHNLMILDSYREAISGNPELTPASLQLDIAQRNERLENLLVELKHVNAKLESFKTTDIQIDSWMKVQDTARADISSDIDIHDIGKINSVLENLNLQIGAQKSAVDEYLAKLNSQHRNAQKIAFESGLPPAEDQTPAQVTSQIERLLETSKSAVSSLKDFEEMIFLDKDASFENLEAKLQACILSFEKASKAVENESVSNLHLKNKEMSLLEKSSLFSKISSAIDNLTRAQRTLSGIVQNHSLETATADSFRFIRSKVSHIFSQIHSPVEYELGEISNGTLIKRRDDGSSHEANQVSTGQRAALALSIFLALNESAKNAPPIILIDDPIAHIDDLNALSFLDYLRDIALAGKKQIFFATADARLAALFQRKFEFLGEQRFSRINLPNT